MKKLVIILVVCLLLTACQTEPPTPSQPYIEKMDFGLGTVIRIKLYDKQSPEVIELILNRIHEIENRMSYSLEGSDIYKINHAKGQPVTIHPDTMFVIKEAVRFNQLSKGTFDPTLGVLIYDWGIGSDHARIPSDQEIAAGLATIGTDKISFIDETTIQVADGTELDLGAIAKGYAADEAARICTENGVHSAIIDLGGNILAHGSKDGNDFKVGIRNPFDGTGASIGVLSLQDKTVVTSGNYERYFEVDGWRYHHILDYRTGYPVENDLASVSIITDASIEADGYSTSVYAMGLDEGLSFVNSQNNLEAIFVLKDKRVIISEGLKNNFILDDANFQLVE